MNDRIFIENLRVRCRVGLTPEERSHPQDVIVDVSLFLSLQRALESDSVGDSINYKEVMERISTFVSGKEFVLLEGLAGAVTEELLRASPVERVRLRVRKSKYTTEPSIGVELEREKARRGGGVRRSRRS